MPTKLSKDLPSDAFVSEQSETPAPGYHHLTPSSVPLFFPLPPVGPDRFFGLGRSSYYDLERRGMLRLIRVKKPGNVRGKVLVPFAETAALIRRLGQEGA